MAFVSQVGAGAVPERLAEQEPHGHRWMTVELVGEGRRGGLFERGVAQHPTIGDTVHMVTEEGLNSALILGIGQTFDYGGVSIPVNLVFTRNNDGGRLSLPFGYAIQKRR